MGKTIVYNIPSTYNSGGMERVLSVKANYLADVLGWKVIIITTDQKNRPNFFDFSDKIQFIDLGINYSDLLPCSLVKKLIKRLNLRKKHSRVLKKTLDGIHPHVIVSMFQQDASLIPKITNCKKIILEAHFSRYVKSYIKKSGFINNIISRFHIYKDRNIARKYTRFVTLTDEDKPYWNLSNVEVIPNPITIDRNYENESFSSHSKKILAVGRFTKQKGFDMLIEIWSQIWQKHTDWQLVIIGSQEDEVYVSGLKLLISKYNIPSTSLILKPPSKNITKDYEKSDIIVLPSRYEGLPLVLIESQSFGKPAVAFACKCGPRDIINNGVNGFLVEPFDKREFGNKLEELIENSKLREKMGRQSLELSKRYEVEPIMRKWEKLFLS